MSPDQTTDRIRALRDRLDVFLRRPGEDILCMAEEIVDMANEIQSAAWANERGEPGFSYEILLALSGSDADLRPFIIAPDQAAADRRGEEMASSMGNGWSLVSATCVDPPKGTTK